MEFFYLFSLIPVLIGLVLFLKHKQIIWQEFVITGLVSFVLAAIFHALIATSLVEDVETWSGRITKAVHYPEWVERYRTTERYPCGTDSDGHTKWCSRTVIRYRTHHEKWQAETDLDYSKDISKEFFNEISKNFFNYTIETPHKSGFVRGDKNIYVAYNKSGYIYPVTDLRTFENRIKASKTIFDFIKVPTNIHVYNWPENLDWRASDRLMGTAQLSITVRDWDVLNTELGYKKGVNLILIGFETETDRQMGLYQEAKWLGGKKNDLVLCYGGGTHKNPSWSYVFSWSESELVKRNLETILLTNSINSSIIPIIKDEVEKNYILKDWSKFDYISLRPPTWSYFVFVFLIVAIQCGIWYCNFTNEFGKEKKNKYIERYY